VGGDVCLVVVGCTTASNGPASQGTVRVMGGAGREYWGRGVCSMWERSCA
jgi:hypothetical protein